MNVTLPTTTTWTATATPQGNQINDTCGTYTLTNLGVQTNSTTATGCW
jgi:type IV pilus assembly protein PilE